jgi:hypothetical protein
VLERFAVHRLFESVVELAWRLNGTGPSKFLDPIDRAVLQGPVDT